MTENVVDGGNRVNLTCRGLNEAHEFTLNVVVETVVYGNKQRFTRVYLLDI